METIKGLEIYPVKTVILSNIVSIGIYVLGFLIIFKLGIAYSLLWLFYVSFFEFRLLKKHCTRCFYWGKVCGFGKDRVSSQFFKKGDISNFCSKTMTWKNLIPDILLTLIPLVVGIVLLILKFEPILFFALLVLILFTTMGNGYIRGTLTCKYCKQKELGCPADMLFQKKK